MALTLLAQGTFVSDSWYAEVLCSVMARDTTVVLIRVCTCVKREMFEQPSESRVIIKAYQAHPGSGGPNGQAAAFRPEWYLSRGWDCGHDWKFQLLQRAHSFSDGHGR